MMMLHFFIHCRDQDQGIRITGEVIMKSGGNKLVLVLRIGKLLVKVEIRGHLQEPRIDMLSPQCSCQANLSVFFGAPNPRFQS